MNRKLLLRSIFRLLTTGVVLGTILSFSNSEDPRILKILNQIELFTSRNKLQKVYVKTDKDKYIIGETIWLKSYLLNATSLKPEIASNEIYVDLVGKNNTIIQNIILKNIDGFANGDIFLNDSIPQGNYQLVAYTNWMKNFDEAFFFSKTIEIVNPIFNKYITNDILANIKNYNKQIQSDEKNKIIQFFPESGNLVAGIQCHVAFKTINNLGNGVETNGDIYDDKNIKVCHFESKHLGMGDFYFTPETGKRYYAKVKFADGSTKNFDLPDVHAKGYVMLVNSLVGDQIRLNIQSNLGNQIDEKNNDFIIVGQSRGEVKFISKGVNKGKPINAVIPKKNFPAGIAQITLFNGTGEPICERLVFIQQKEKESKTLIIVEKTNDGSDILFKISLKQSDGNPSKGNVALSIHEALDGAKNVASKENILSNLLLTSDLKGKVENASQYFDETNSESPIMLDYVMMVNGWRRFVWKEILAGQFQALLFTPSEGLNSNEITTTTLKPISYDLTGKAYPVPLNEQFDSKMIKKNSREAAKLKTGTVSDATPNKLVINQKTNSYSSMIEYLKGRFAGVNVTNNGIRLSGVNSINSGTEALIIVDEMSVSFSTLTTISPKDVTSVEVLKGPDASMYGVRGANGVIIVHLRKGNEGLKETKIFEEQAYERIVSFYKAREFYVPVYDSWENKPSTYNVPRSVYWKPNIAIDSTGQATVSFKNRGNIANLQISIEGIADGSVLFYETKN